MFRSREGRIEPSEEFAGEGALCAGVRDIGLFARTALGESTWGLAGKQVEVNSLERVGPMVHRSTTKHAFATLWGFYFTVLTSANELSGLCSQLRLLRRSQQGR